MYAYYMAWWAYKDTKNNNTRKQLHKFDNKYMEISSRQRGNHAMINPTILWNHLRSLPYVKLRAFSRILGW